MMSQSNAHKITAANVSLEFLKKEVRKLSEEQKRTRLMLLEIMENTRPYVLQDKPDKQEDEPKLEPKPKPSSSWFWG